MNGDGRIPLILGNSTVASATTTVGAQYEVFLSFCGKDTRKGFTDFLYTYLKGASIRTFKDNEGLHVGEEIGPVLLKALKESKISIPIFSKNYAYSKWCLCELVQMVQCHENKGQVIYPIFYDVDPYDVRHQSGSYEEAFHQHRKKRFKEKTIQEWKQALKKTECILTRYKQTPRASRNLRCKDKRKKKRLIGLNSVWIGHSLD
ncbi:hypothetical protein LguiB_013952 [Lonicera macranthoides]